MTASLSGDFLLLAIGPRATYRTVGPVGLGLAGAVLCESVLAGETPTAVGDQRHRVRSLTKQVETLSRSVVASVAPGLCEAGTIGPFGHTSFGLFTRRGYAVLDEAALSAAQDRLVAALVPGPPPGVEGAALAVLCAISGVAGKVVPPPHRRPERRTVAAHLNALSEVVGPDLADVLVATRRAYGRANASDVAFVPVDGSSAYGDAGGHGASGGHDGGGGGGHGGH